MTQRVRKDIFVSYCTSITAEMRRASAITEAGVK